MCNAVSCYGIEARVAPYHLCVGLGGGVSLIHCVDILQQPVVYLRKAFKENSGQFLSLPVMEIGGGLHKVPQLDLKVKILHFQLSYFLEHFLGMFREKNPKNIFKKTMDNLW